MEKRRDYERKIADEFFMIQLFYNSSVYNYVF